MCRKAKSLSERSEFDLADAETTNFWQRSRHSLDFSLILDFAHAQQTENKFSFVFAQSQNCFVSFGQAKEMKEPRSCKEMNKPIWSSKRNERNRTQAKEMKENQKAQLLTSHCSLLIAHYSLFPLP